MSKKIAVERIASACNQTIFSQGTLGDIVINAEF